MQFINVCHSAIFVLWFGVSFICGQSNNNKPPEKWQKRWEGQVEELTLVYSDNYVAFYFDKKMDRSLTRPFKLMSDAWRVAKEFYGPFPEDPILYFVLHQHWTWSCKSELLDSSLEHNSGFKSGVAVDCMYNLRAEDIDQHFFMQELAKITFQQRVHKDFKIWPAMRVSFTHMSSILVYDIYKQIGLMSEGEDFQDRFFHDEIDFPRHKAEWYKGWYKPIYTNYGGSTVLNEFFTFVETHWPRNEQNGTTQMNIGEFIHFWSCAAGEDLRELAFHGLGLSATDDLQLIAAREKFCDADHTYTAKELLPPQKTWVEGWESHTETLTLAYSDDHVAFYFDNKVEKSTTWPFKMASDGWKYAKETFGPFGLDPVLYIILHGEESEQECHVLKSPSLETFGNRKIIDCESSPEGDEEWEENWENANKFMKQLGTMIMNFAKDANNWPAFQLTSSTASHIFTYDIITHLEDSVYPTEWVNKTQEEALKTEHRDIFWYRDWWFPIYSNYGGAKVLNDFLNDMYAHWPRREQNYVGDMTVGDFLHFWSGAVGVDLWDTASNIVGWKLQYHEQYLRAKEKFPEITYSDGNARLPSLKWTEDWAIGGDHTDELTLVFISTTIAVYFDSKVDHASDWPFQMLSDGWEYAQKTYGPFGSDPFLYFVMHEGDSSPCSINKQYSSTDKQIENRTIIDCTRSHGGWKFDDTYQQDKLMEMVAIALFRGTKVDTRWVSFSTFYSLGWRIYRLMLFDIYMNIGETENAVRYLDETLQDVRSHLPVRYEYWFRDWYYPIYDTYGGSIVFKQFFTLLKTTWNRPDSWEDYAFDLNTGEFVHFWSGAAGDNLKYLALGSFGWTENDDVLLANAKRDYPTITYQEKEEIDGALPLVSNQDLFGHEDLLFLKYADDDIVVYYDGYVPSSVMWPHSFLSYGWHRIKNTYSLICQSYFVPLHVILHAKDQYNCQTMWNVSIKAKSAESSRDEMTKINTIDCGQPGSNAWGNKTKHNTDLLAKSFANLIQQSANQTESQSAYYFPPMLEMIVFDFYLEQGNLEEAYKWMRRSFRKKEVQSAGEIFWFRDWYTPIYINYGGVNVVNNFFVLLSQYWQRSVEESVSRNSKLNIGELIHFWSSAADASLIQRGRDAVEWTQLYLDQFIAARKQFSNLTYACYDCDLPKVESQTPVIIGASSLAGICFILICLSLFLLYRRQIKRLKEQIRELTAEEVKEFFDGSSSAKTTGAQPTVESEPFNKEYEIPKEHLEIYDDKVLGFGEFGLVLQGNLKQCNSSPDIKVAIKTVKTSVDVALFKSLLMELKVLGFLGTNEYIASLIGAVTVNIKNRELYIAIEFCDNGDLLGYLKKNKATFNDLFFKTTAEVEIPIESDATKTGENSKDANKSSQNVDPSTCRRMSTLDLLDWSIQIAQGMAYVSSKNVIHGDLAARNVLLTKNRVCKISDFGLSRQLNNYSTYMKKSQTPLPWRWMAIESLQEMNFSTRSDVWAFGVTLFEIFTLGGIPYPGCNWSQDFLTNLIAGLRLKSPQYGNNEVYHIMMDCMKEVPEERISCAEIAEKMHRIRSQLVNQSRVTYTNMNYAIMEPASI